ncbi:MAG: hypothetical protein V2I43_13640 [Parvularcula sp.]|jgi:hypothetical protein|nr:hypothetical protein [Parvularcula sp.]
MTELSQIMNSGWLSPRRVQNGIAAVFLSLGGWAILFPEFVVSLTMTPPYREGAGVPFVLGCFGLQACICGALLLLTTLDRRGFILFALICAPFLVFDVWFVVVQPVLTPLGGALDGIGNIIMISLCLKAASDFATSPTFSGTGTSHEA